MSSPAPEIAYEFNSPAALRYRRRRHLHDVLTRYLMAFGGISVIIAIVLIAFYLLWVVLPMFTQARLDHMITADLPGNAAAETLYYGMEEQREIGLRADTDGHITFFRVADGNVVRSFDLLAGRTGAAGVSTFAASERSLRFMAYGLSDGRVIVMRHDYAISYPDDVRLIAPHLSYPAGEEPLVLDPQGRAIVRLAVTGNNDSTVVIGYTGDRRLLLLHVQAQRSLLGDEVTLRETRSELLLDHPDVTHLLVGRLQRQVYAAGSDGSISYFDITSKASPQLVQRFRAVPGDARVTAMEFLSGSVSVIVGDSRGTLTQWFPVRDENNNYTVERIRDFQQRKSPVTTIAPEYYRKSFAAGDEQGYVGMYNTTAHRKVYLDRLADTPVRHLAIAPRADGLLLQAAANRYEFLHVDNPHPEVSWSSIWGKVWYENRSGPEWIWQSTSATSDFESKFSLTPLAFGTFKAAFYAMLIAIPLSILGAIYTAYFMSPKIRGVVKPTIEIMEALPTVILGFLAGLWFAPFVEKHLPGMFMMLLTLPLFILATSYLWSRMPTSVRTLVPDGWEAVLLVPVLLFATWLSFTLSVPVEVWLFGGNMPYWLSNELGIPYDQRNSMVVGFAMGFAVIPTIFSISEDAIYNAPKHLTTGSLALGATRWQTMTRVILLTASPGIFSAIMIGLGRAVGETMIVVMATGNTAIVDMNIFQGFRALSANIAVEMPESEVNSSHYRILFLAGLVLFLATFIFNTAAELVRQRLRRKYSSL